MFVTTDFHLSTSLLLYLHHRSTPSHFLVSRSNQFLNPSKFVSLVSQKWKLLSPTLFCFTHVRTLLLFLQVPLFPSVKDGRGGWPATLQLRAGHRSCQLLASGRVRRSRPGEAHHRVLAGLSIASKADDGSTRRRQIRLFFCCYPLLPYISLMIVYKESHRIENIF